MAQDIDFSGRPTKSDQRKLKAQARSSDDMLAQVYEDGRREGRRQAKSGRSTTTGRARKSAARTTGKAVGRQARRARPGARQLTNPSRAEVSSGIQLVGLTLAVIALYLVLQNATGVSGALGGLARGIAWLSSPSTSIPYYRPSSPSPGADPTPAPVHS
ncbi:MAG: hypothetical protein WDA30_24950 [Mycolicibacterium sp.]